MERHPAHHPVVKQGQKAPRLSFVNRRDVEMACFRDPGTGKIAKVPELAPAMVKRERHKARAFLLDARWD